MKHSAQSASTLTVTGVRKYFKTHGVSTMVNYVILCSKWHRFRYRDLSFLDYLLGLKFDVVIEKGIDKLESENDNRICKWDSLLNDLYPQNVIIYREMY